MKLSSFPSDTTTSNICPICNGKAATTLYQLAEGVYKRCPTCGLVRVEPLPTMGQMNARAELWSGAHHASPEKVQQVYSNNFQNVAYGDFLKRILPYRQSGRLLDVGCSIGGFLDAAQKAGWDAYGIDISPSITVASEHGLKPWRGRLEDASFSQAYFDVITMFEVIEHIVDLDAFMLKLKELIRPGGGLLIVTPNLDSISSRLLGSRWPAVEPEDHITLFTPATLTRLLARYQFSRIEYSTIDINIVSIKSLFRGRSSLEDRQRLQKEGRRFIKTLVNSFLLKFLRKTANYFLDITNLGERLVVLAEYRPPSDHG